MSNDRIAGIEVLQGAPCGATWEAALRILNLPVKEALVRIGLDVQYYCTADPSGWDPVHGKSPVHVAGKIHQTALKAALGKASERQSGQQTENQDTEDD